MRNHIPLGSIFGIRIWLSRWVLWIAAALAIFGGLPLLLLSVVLFGLVLLHELGHSVVAKHYGITVSHITLWPLGGVAWMEEIPEDPKIEGLIAIAGPAVNFALALCALPVLLFTGNPFVAYFIYVNIALGGFNLIPAFPMDGGRILRSLLGLKYEWLQATEIAVRVGRTLAIVGGIAGLMSGQFMVPFVAAYVWFMGQRELFAMRAKKLGTAFPFAGFAEAARRAAGAAGGAAGAGATGGPQFGFETPAGFAPAPGTAGPRRPEQQAPRDAEPARPDNLRRDEPEGGGFSEEDIERLEQFHGRLRRDWKDEL